MQKRNFRKEEKKEEVVKAPVEKEESVPARKEKETAVVTEESKKAVEAFLLDTLKAMGMESGDHFRGGCRRSTQY